MSRRSDYNHSFQFVFLVPFHFHSEAEDGAFVFTFGVDRDSASILIHKVLADHEAHPDSFRVHLCCPLQLAKLLKEFGSVFFDYSLASVKNVHFQKVNGVIEGYSDADQTSDCEL